MLLDFEIHTRPNNSNKDTVAVEEGDELQDVEVTTFLPIYAIISVLLVQRDPGAFLSNCSPSLYGQAAFVYRTCLTPDSL